MRKGTFPIVIVALLILTVVIAWWYNSKRLDDFIENPEVGDIYILKDEDVYAPIKIDRIEENEIWMRNYLYMFAEAVPDRQQILDGEFDQSSHLIYKRSELERMYEEGKIVEIYRD